jgi:hypothetical protein
VREGFSALGWAGRIETLFSVLAVRTSGPIR